VGARGHTHPENDTIAFETGLLFSLRKTGSGKTHGFSSSCFFSWFVWKKGIIHPITHYFNDTHKSPKSKDKNEKFGIIGRVARPGFILLYTFPEREKRRLSFPFFPGKSFCEGAVRAIL